MASVQRRRRTPVLEYMVRQVISAVKGTLEPAQVRVSIRR